MLYLIHKGDNKMNNIYLSTNLRSLVYDFALDYDLKTRNEDSIIVDNKYIISRDEDWLTVASIGENTNMNFEIYCNRIEATDEGEVLELELLTTEGSLVGVIDIGY